MPKEYKFVIQEISYRHITIKADNYDAAKAEFERGYYSCEYVDAREDVSETNLLTRCGKCGELVDIDYMSENAVHHGIVCSSCRNKAVLR